MISSVIRLIPPIYAALLRLYPRHFREEFESEMQIVFSATIAEAARSGALALVTVCLRELRDLPGRLLDEHLLGYKSLLSQHLTHPSQWGALGFGVGFALIEIASGTTRVARGIPYNFGIDLHLGMVLYPAAGALGGTFLKIGDDSSGRTSQFALAGALGCGLGYLAPLILNPTPNVLLRGAIMGALIGTLIGGAQKNWWQLIRLTLAGALGFGLGRLAQNVALVCTGQLSRHPPDYAYMMSPWPIVLGALSSAVAGIVGGAILGLALGRCHAARLPESMS